MTVDKVSRIHKQVTEDLVSWMHSKDIEGMTSSTEETDRIVYTSISDEEHKWGIEIVEDLRSNFPEERSYKFEAALPSSLSDSGYLQYKFVFRHVFQSHPLGDFKSFDLAKEGLGEYRQPETFLSHETLNKEKPNRNTHEADDMASYALENIKSMFDKIWLMSDLPK